MYTKGKIIFGLIFNAVIILVISQLAVGSLNPIEVFHGESLFLKILVGVLLGGFLMQLLALAFFSSLANKNCAKCGLPLVAYAGSHGNPVRCIICGNWYHTNCLKIDGGSPTGCRQPHCRSGSGF